MESPRTEPEEASGRQQNSTNSVTSETSNAFATKDGCVSLLDYLLEGMRYKKDGKIDQALNCFERVLAEREEANKSPYINYLTAQCMVHQVRQAAPAKVSSDPLYKELMEKARSLLITTLNLFPQHVSAMKLLQEVNQTLGTSFDDTSFHDLSCQFD